MKQPSLLTKGNPKTLKGEKKGYLTYILHLAPADLSGYQVCPNSTEGCRAACLNTAGRGGMFKRGENTNAIQKARIRKTKYFFENRAKFMAELVVEIEKSVKSAQKKGLVPVFRLNGTSDLPWAKIRVSAEHRNLMERFPDVQFYDYTKVLHYAVTAPKNYSVTFSRAENNPIMVKTALDNKVNVAVVFSSKNLPATFKGVEVVNGDESDLRFLDKKGVVVGLYAKGRAKKDTSGFVVPVGAQS